MTNAIPDTPTLMSDAQVDRSLKRIHNALGRVAEQLEVPDSPPEHHISPPAAEKDIGQAEGGLQRNALQRGSMLITKESSSRLAAERKSATDDLAGHVGSVLRELNSVRTETTRLLDQRRQLEVYLAALKTELEGLRAEKVELMALKAVVRPHASTETEVDLVARARAAVHGEDAAGSVAPVVNTDEPVPASAPPSAFNPGGKKDEDAFRAFLLADEDHDKSREWFLSHQS